jgi:8-oxo-dGTP pyrophosphatase MutT (NUDIX family)
MIRSFSNNGEGFRMQLIKAAVTMVLRRGLRDTPEVLLVHRNPLLPVQGGIWAFPGGRIAPADHNGAPGLHASRNCAVREAAEETGLRLNAAALRPAARWITPEKIEPRFDTWMFICETHDGAVRVDGREIIDYRWLTAAAALQDHNQVRIRLSPPAFVMLSILAQSPEATRVGPLDSVLRFNPRLVESAHGRCSLYEGDAGYRDRTLERPGARHRLWMGPDAWRYERRL